MNRRVFTFGCSYTKWNWPTWADIINWDLGLPFQNWGIGGLGNVGIMHRMVECDLKNKFTNNDLILVVWSNWTREDRFLNNEWVALGNVFNNNFYDENFIKKYWSFQNDIVKNSTAIISSNKMFNITFQGHIMPIAEFESNSNLAKNSDFEILNLYRNFLPVNNIYKNEIDEFNKLIKDGHPSILQHLNYVKEYIYPELKLKLKPSTIKLCEFLQQELIKELKIKRFDSINNKFDLIRSILVKKYKIKYGKYML